ncbi:LysM peptidoglycan-binding domain-containing protein [Streptococcus panodentis]|uniref:Peptidoglycan-binding protein n=1 Tax=Streptococcus panodentis TaxID=1581472 RepID=A0ABS5AWR9_9STRE|nr:LysM peptidoglycan-binding domain-containing protein [Streptococcus panodentis]MBP2621024.1 peptidoglycan-binding protein [Streptococcus panodentis]
MKMNKKVFLASTLALSVFPLMNAQAEEQSENWTARTVDQIKADITSNENQQTYTVQYGDTLGNIAQAMNIDVADLARINQIANADLIFPGTVLSITTNEHNEITSVEIQSYQAQAENAAGPVTQDLTADEIFGDDQAAPAAPAPAQPAAAPEDAYVSAAAEENAAPAAPAPAEPAPAAPSDEDALVPPAPVNADEVSQAVPAEPAPEAPAPQAAETPAAPELGQEEVSQAAAQAEPTAYNAPAVTDAASVATGNPANAGLQPQTAAFKEEVASQFGVTEFSLYREGDSGDHGKGLAVDFIVGDNTELGNQIADYATADMSGNGISYVIWQQQFYSPYESIYGPANTWNSMPDRGSATENHYDHVHVSMNE